MSSSRYIAIAAGGTAGHINPALALAEVLKARGHKVSFIGQTTHLEAKLVTQAGFDFIPIHVSGFDRRRPWTVVSALMRMMSAKRVLAHHFRNEKPDVCVGFGAYVELALVEWAKSQQVPIVLHEQNSIVGLANKLSARKASAVCVAFPQAMQAFRPHISLSCRLEVVGNPTRSSITDATREASRAKLNIPAHALVLLVFGGSLGAQHLNEQIVRRKGALLGIEGLYIIHATGQSGYDTTRSCLDLTEDEAQRWRLVPYIDDMGAALAASDLVVSRAGASTIAEIAAVGRPSILVPYPQATADHQTMNAHLLVDAGAARLVKDIDLDREVFDDALFDLLENSDLRQTLHERASQLSKNNASLRLADVVESYAHR